MNIILFISLVSYYEKIGSECACINGKLPFEIPNNWTWCRGTSVFLPMETRKPKGKCFKYIDIDSIDNSHQQIKSPKSIAVADAPSRAVRAVYTGSVLFSMVRPYLKNIALIEEKNADCIASSGFFVATSNGAFYPQYLYYLMISSYVVLGLNQFMKGDNSPSVNKDNIEKFLYPVPPIKEQEQIAKKIKEMVGIIEKVEVSLK